MAMSKVDSLRDQMAKKWKLSSETSIYGNKKLRRLTARGVDEFYAVKRIFVEWEKKKGFLCW